MKKINKVREIKKMEGFQELSKKERYKFSGGYTTYSNSLRDLLVWLTL